MAEQERFEKSLDVILLHEGGYSNDPDDPGGETNFGITQKSLTKVYVQLGLPAHVKDLDKKSASIFYKTLWWDKYNYSAINSLNIATKIFDLSVNIGPKMAHMILQKAINWCGHRVITDGVLGKKTLAAANEIYLHGRDADLYDEIKEEARNYYTHLTEENPKLYKYLGGWLNRANQ